MKAMQELQPRMKQLQDKYKNDPAKLQAEMVHYKEMGVNPLAGCLPLLVQMPFLITIYWALKRLPIRSKLCTILVVAQPWRSRSNVHLTYFLSALSTWVMSRQTSNGATGTTGKQQKIMTIFMPLFIGYISFELPIWSRYLV